MTTWATSVQAAVTAIRKAGATTQHILLPGTGYTSAESYVSSGSAAALGKVTNLDGSTDNLIFDVHKYLDSDNSGTHAACVSNDISNAFQPLATYLTQNKRVALLSEIGGGSNNPSCLTDLCKVADFLNQNSGAYLGFLGWSAGSFDPTSYVLSLTPTQSGSTWTDQPLLTKCIAGKFSGGSGTGTTPPSSGGSSTPPSSGGTSVPPPSGGSSTYGGSSVPAATGSPAPITSSYAPVSTSAGSGGNAPISYGRSSSWGLSNNTVSATGTGGPTGTGAPNYQPTTFATSVIATSSQGYGGSPSAQGASGPSSTSILTGPGNNDGASVWGSKSRIPNVGGGSGTVSSGQGADDGEDCEAEYV